MPAVPAPQRSAVRQSRNQNEEDSPRHSIRRTPLLMRLSKRNVRKLAKTKGIYDLSTQSDFCWRKIGVLLRRFCKELAKSPMSKAGEGRRATPNNERTNAGKGQIGRLERNVPGRWRSRVMLPLQTGTRIERPESEKSEQSADQF